MPCQMDGPVVIHGTDCRCSECIAEQRETSRQERLRRKFFPLYLKQLKKAYTSSRIQSIIHVEPHHLPDMDFVDNRKDYNNQVETWLKNCHPFPEDLKVATVNVFDFSIVFTHHIHRNQS